MEAKGKRIAYPWGSKRVRLTQLRQLAQALELPITGGNADLQVMVEGKLREMRDPSSIQVVLKESIVEGQQTILLEYVNGTFLKRSRQNIQGIQLRHSLRLPQQNVL